MAITTDRFWQQSFFPALKQAVKESEPHWRKLDEAEFHKEIAHPIHSMTWLIKGQVLPKDAVIEKKWITGGYQDGNWNTPEDEELNPLEAEQEPAFVQLETIVKACFATDLVENCMEEILQQIAQHKDHNEWGYYGGVTNYTSVTINVMALYLWCKNKHISLLGQNV